MPNPSISRRNFMNGASALLLASLPGRGLLAQASLRQRLDWNTFRTTRDYSSFIDGVGRMKQITMCI